METNEVQWHPPEQLLSVAPDTQTADDDQLPGFDSEQKCEQDDVEDKDDYEEAKGDLGIQIVAICLVVCVLFSIVTVVKVEKEKQLIIFTKSLRCKFALCESSAQ